jgi:phosphoribosylglycinamide formyltransferase-1
LERTHAIDEESDVTQEARPPVGVLISGRGSNLHALVEAVARGDLKATLRVVIANKPGAPGLAIAAAAGIETLVLPHRDYPAREAYDRALVDALRARGVVLVCLAGFMRLLGPVFCAAFPDAVLNIHPSLLPAFPGTDAQGQALARGVKVSGATVHFVTPELDAGPIVSQASVPVLDADTTDSLARRILDVEHALYPAAVQRVLHGSWRIEAGRVIFADGAGPYAP